MLSSATFDNGGVPFRGAKSLDLLALTHAVDPEGDAFAFSVNRIMSGAHIGSLTVSGAAATFVPSADVEGSAVFELVAVDSKGAVSSPALLTVASVDTKPPPLDAPQYDVISPTHYEVTASIHTTETEEIQAPAGWNRLGASSNWTFSRTYTANIANDPFTLTDRAGNASTRLITIANIDKVSPSVEDAAYSSTSPTNQDVVATFCSAENLTAPAGWAMAFEPGSGKYAFTNTYAANAAETISFFDAAGNRTDKVVTITWIDKTPPAVVTFEAATSTNTTIDLHVVADESGKGYLWFPTIIPGTEPTVVEVVQHATTDAAVVTLTKNEVADYPRTGLQADTPYATFLVTEDALGNQSTVRKLSLRTPQNPDAPTHNPSPTGSQSSEDVIVAWGLSDADGVQLGKVDLYTQYGTHLATNSNASGAAQVTFTTVPRGSYFALAYGKALNGTTGSWQDITSPQSAAIAVANHAPVLPSPITLPASTQGTAYSQTLPLATDLEGDPITYALAGTLPAGLSFSAATRVLAGTPVQAGTFSLTYTASDSYGGSASQSLPLTVRATTYTLTYSAGANGSITGTTPQTVAYKGSGSAVTAVAATGYHFTTWSDGVLTATRTDASVLANLSVTASFAVNTFTLTYSAGANGSITGTTPQTVAYNGSGSGVTAVAAMGYRFTTWSDGVLTASRTDSAVVANLSVTATFALLPAVTGLVTDFEKKTPLAGVTVALEGTSFSATTDSLGAFTLNTVPAGTYNLKLSHPDFLEKSFSIEVITGEVAQVAAELNPAVIQTSVSNTGWFSQIYPYADANGTYAEVALETLVTIDFASLAFVRAELNFDAEYLLSGSGGSLLFLSSSQQVTATVNLGEWWVGNDAVLGSSLGAFLATTPLSHYTLDVTDFVRNHPGSAFFLAASSSAAGNIRLQNIQMSIYFR